SLEDTTDVLSDLRRALDLLPDGSRLEVSARRTPQVLRIPVELGAHPMDAPPVRPVPQDAEIHGAILGQSSSLETFGSLAVSHFGLDTDTADLRQRLARLGGFDDGFHLDDVRFVQRNPWHVALVAADVLAALAPLGDPDDLAQ